MSGLRLEAQHRGPATSANGGWTAGVLAARLPGAAAVTVTLRLPPPLERDLDVRGGGDSVALRDGEALVAEAVVGEPPEPVPSVDADEAAAAEAAYAGLVDHPFPGCFVCGTTPPAGQGLRLRPGPVGPGRTACTWTPHPAHTSAAHVWAALDCPSGWTDDIAGRPMVLGRITASVHRRPVSGERLVVVGALLDRVGRKTLTAASVYDAAGLLVGTATHTWIRVDPTAFA